jgi:adenylate kinase
VRALFFGPPGSGKGTQAAALAGRRGLPHVSSGDLLRAAQRAGTPLGRQAAAYMERGALVPDPLVLDLLLERLASPDCGRGFLLDGFPRNLPQAKALEGRLSRAGRAALDRALRFLLSDEAVLERLSGRRSCKGCGTPYHVRFHPPRVEGRCDRCGGELLARPDDAPSVVRERLAVHRRDEEDLVEFYRRQEILKEVEARGTVEEVAGRVEAALGGG